jgi:DNA-binding MarR family transcriptional regulator
MAPAQGKPPADAADTFDSARSAHLNVKIAAQRFDGHVEQICRRYNISQAQFGVLWVLCLAPNAKTGMPVGEIADGLITRASDATRLIDRLEAAGLVERLRHPDDRRSVLVRATTAGKRVFKTAAPQIDRYHAEAWSNLTNTELITLDRLLIKALWNNPDTKASDTCQPETARP